MGVFAPENSLFYNILKPLNLILEFNPQNSIFSFSYAMFTGIIAIMLFETLLTKFILKTIIEFDPQFLWQYIRLNPNRL